MLGKISTPVRNVDVDYIQTGYCVMLVPFGDKWHTTIEVEFDRIVQIFGAPTYDGNDDRTDVRWRILTPNGAVQLYNHKNGKAFLGISGLEVEDITHWQIRADEADGAEWVHRTLR